MAEEEQTVICAWCGVVLTPGSRDTITHGICSECAEKVLTVIDDIGAKLGATLPPTEPAPTEREGAA